MMGKKRSAKMSEAMTGKKHSAATRAKISEAMMGKKRSAKMSEAMTGKKRSAATLVHEVPKHKVYSLEVIVIYLLRKIIGFHPRGDFVYIIHERLLVRRHNHRDYDRECDLERERRRLGICCDVVDGFSSRLEDDLRPLPLPSDSFLDRRRLSTLPLPSSELLSGRRRRRRLVGYLPSLRFPVRLSRDSSLS
jgi:hypothetical protein